MSVRKLNHMLTASAALALLLTAPSVLAQSPSPTPRVILPFELVDTLDGARFKIRVPANWNGTLLIFSPGTRTAAAPPVPPRVVPPVLPVTDTSLEPTLFASGYALAASWGTDSDWQLKANVQDTLTLLAYFRGRVGEPTRVIAWGTSLGGLTTLRLIENYPRSFHGGIPMCSPAAGEVRRLDANLDFALAYAAAFGWNDTAWGPLSNIKPGLVYPTDIQPYVNWPKSDNSNFGGWEFIRLVTGIPADTFWAVDPGLGSYGYHRLLAGLWQISSANRWAGGNTVQNLDRRYELSVNDHLYLTSFGVQPAAMLAWMNRQNIAAAPTARRYVERHGDVYGTLTKPLLTIHTTRDTVADIRNESAYRETVTQAGALNNLVQGYVAAVGHCAFTSPQLLASLTAMENWLNTGVKPGPAAFPETLGFAPTYLPPAWPWPSSAAERSKQ